jgi:hypothetical protein
MGWQIELPTLYCDRNQRYRVEPVTMDVKDAVQLAKGHVADLFSNEGVEDIGLEEVDYDDDRLLWRITIGFTRPWDRRYSALLNPAMKRSYKIVTIDPDGKVLSVKNRETTNA